MVSGIEIRVLRAATVCQMRQEAFDYGRAFDADNQPHRPTAGFASLNAPLEHAHQAFGPAHHRLESGTLASTARSR